MHITVIGTESLDHLRIPGQPGTTEREGGPLRVAAEALREIPDVIVASVPGRASAWTDVDLELGGSLTVVTNTPVRPRGLLDATAFLVVPLAAGEWTFDQLELLCGKVFVDATGLARVVNTREPQAFSIPERFLPLIDVFVLPWADRHLMPEAQLKELKKEHIVLLTKGADGADVYVRGAKFTVPPSRDLPHVLILHPQVTLLASFAVHFLRTHDAHVAMRFAQEAVRARFQDPQALPLPAHVRAAHHRALDEDADPLAALAPPQPGLF